MSLPVLATEETQPTCCSSTNVYRFLHDIGILRQRATTVHHHHPCHEQAAMKSSQTSPTAQNEKIEFEDENELEITCYMFHFILTSQDTVTP